MTERLPGANSSFSLKDTQDIMRNATNTTRYLQMFRTSPTIKATFCVIYSIISVGIVLGNVIVVSVFLRKRKLRSRTAYFLVSLALADIIVGSVGVPLYVYILAESVEFPSFAYILWNTIDVFGATASIWHLMTISLERFYAIGWPFQHRLSTRKSYYCLVGLVWCVSLLLCIITVVFGSTWFYYPLFISLASFVLPLSVIVVAYIAMFIIALKSVHHSHREARGAEKEARIAKAILIVIGCFLVAWAPFFGLNFAYWACRSCVNIKYEVILVFKILQYSGSLSNPVIYALRLPGFCKAVQELYGHCFKCQKPIYLDNQEYPLAPDSKDSNNVELIKLRGIDNVSFRDSYSQPLSSRKSGASGHSRKGRRPFRKSKNITLSTLLQDRNNPRVKMHRRLENKTKT